jgi:hypothetical protein
MTSSVSVATGSGGSLSASSTTGSGSSSSGNGAVPTGVYLPGMALAVVGGLAAVVA